MQLTAQAIAELLNGTVEGDPQIVVDRPSKIEEGGVGSITFLANPKYERFIYETTASVVLVQRDFSPQQLVTATLIRVDDVYASIGFLLNKYQEVGQEQVGGVASSAIVHGSSNHLSPDIFIGENVVVAENVKIGKGCKLYPQVYIGKNVQLGTGVTLHPGVKIYRDCIIGDNCTIHANTVIGSDGFGFAPQSDGSYEKIPQIGNVIIESEVEIGANTTIDRATMGATIIRKGVKIDNLVQIAHNVEIGEHTVIAAQTGVAGSTCIGKYCRIGGQVGFSGHLKIADGTQIQAQSGIASNIKQPNQALFGSPAIGYKDYIKSYAVFKKLPELYKQVARLEKALAAQLLEKE